MARRNQADVWQRAVDELRQRGIDFAAGLTDAEVVRAESRFGFRFPPDLRAFLQTALPQGRGFPDWHGSEAALRDWLDEPRRGVLFDVRRNGFWHPDWGPRPADLDEAQRVAEGLIAQAPKLIPVFMHRMMPDEPRKPGNPVFSVHQTDIIHYGHDLLDYFRQEWKVARWWTRPAEPRPIRFWDIERWQQIRWRDGGCVFDNSAGILPQPPGPG
jgi:hypothetical protein